MTSIELTADQICPAASFQAWSMCLWGKPKATIICGHCKRLFKTRDHFTFNRGQYNEGTAANCPHCGKWNVAHGIVYG